VNLRYPDCRAGLTAILAAMEQNTVG